VTSKHRRQGLLAPRHPRTIVFYGVEPVVGKGVPGRLTPNPAAVLDDTLEEVRPATHREAARDDPWLSPQKSEAIRALLVFINGAQAHNYTLDVVYDTDLDVEGFCQDAELTPRQTEVICLTVDGLSQRAIGAELHLSQSTVWQHLSTGRHKLAGRLPHLVAMRIALPVTSEYNRGVEARLAVG
jgi:predicted DNA-binding protein (UPF0251 family)